VIENLTGESEQEREFVEAVGGARRPSKVGPWHHVAGVLLLAAGIAGCNLGDDFADNLVEKAAKRNEERRIEQQREELPLPDPDVVPYISVTAADLELDEEFKVNLVDDLVLGAGRTDPNYLFVRFSGSSAALGNVAVDGGGRIFVLETRNDEVRVFDADGEFVHTFGQPGEGPTDFQNPYGLIIAGEQAHVFHRSFFSSIWDLDGNFLLDRRTLLTPEAEEEAQLSETTRGTEETSSSEAQRSSQERRFRTPTQVIGRPDGSMLMVFRAEPRGERTGRIATPTVRVLSRFEEGRETERIFEVPEWAGPSFAISQAGELYVGMFGHLRGEHYTIALAADGTPRWTLVTPWNPESPPRMDLRVDGEGRLFLFPNFQADADDPQRPVHVFTPDGELIGSGYMNRRPVWLNWQITKPDHIYGVRVNLTTEEWEVVRYRLEISSE